jgi:hypothetical protein
MQVMCERRDEIGVGIESDVSVDGVLGALMLMNVQLHHVVSDITGLTTMTVLRAILDGVRDPQAVAKHRDDRCKSAVAHGCSPRRGAPARPVLADCRAARVSEEALHDRAGRDLRETLA